MKNSNSRENHIYCLTIPLTVIGHQVELCASGTSGQKRQECLWTQRDQGPQRLSHLSGPHGLSKHCRQLPTPGFLVVLKSFLLFKKMIVACVSDISEERSELERNSWGGCQAVVGASGEGRTTFLLVS